MAIGEIVRFDALDYVPVSVHFLIKDDVGRTSVSTKTVYVPKMLVEPDMEYKKFKELEAMILNSLDYDKSKFDSVWVMAPYSNEISKSLTMMFPIFSDEV